MKVVTSSISTCYLRVYRINGYQRTSIRGRGIKFSIRRINWFCIQCCGIFLWVERAVFDYFCQFKSFRFVDPMNLNTSTTTDTNSNHQKQYILHDLDNTLFVKGQHNVIINIDFFQSRKGCKIDSRINAYIQKSSAKLSIIGKMKIQVN